MSVEEAMDQLYQALLESHPRWRLRVAVQTVLQEIQRLKLELDKAKDTIAMQTDAECMHDTMYTLRSQERDEAQKQVCKIETEIRKVIHSWRSDLDRLESATHPASEVEEILGDIERALELSSGHDSSHTAGRKAWSEDVPRLESELRGRDCDQLG